MKERFDMEPPEVAGLVVALATTAFFVVVVGFGDRVYPFAMAIAGVTGLIATAIVVYFARRLRGWFQRRR